MQLDYTKLAVKTFPSDMNIYRRFYDKIIGSSHITLGDIISTAIITYATENQKKQFKKNIKIEVRYRYSGFSKPHEILVSHLLEKLISKWMINEEDPFKKYIVYISSNTLNLGFAVNSAMLALVNAGIPMISIIYAVGSRNKLWILKENDLDEEYYSAQDSEEPYELDDAKKDIITIREKIYKGIENMFNYREKL